MRKLNAGIALGLTVALIGAALVFAYGRHLNQKIADGRRTLPVLVADTAIPAGTAVSALAGDVHLTQVPVAYLVSNPVTSLGSLSAGTGSRSVTAGVASGLVTLGPITPGAQLSRALFGSPTSPTLVQPAAGHVALALQAGLSPGVAHYLTPGSYVDVFVTYTGVGAGAAGQLVADRTKMFMSAVKVLSVSVAQSPAATAAGTSTASSNAGVGNNVITVLEVTPAAAEKLVNAATLGSIYLALSSRTPQSTPAGVVPLDVVTSNR